MNLYLITYDIVDVNEISLISKIKSFGDCCQVTKSSWLLNSTFDRDDIFGKLLPLFKDGNGHLFLADVSTATMSGWLASNIIDWINNQNNRI